MDDISRGVIQLPESKQPAALPTYVTSCWFPPLLAAPGLQHVVFICHRRAMLVVVVVLVVLLLVLLLLSLLLLLLLFC